MSAIHAIDAAIRAGDLEVLRGLFRDDAAAFPNVRDECGALLLIAAIYHAPVSLIRDLVAAGADVNADPGDGFPSLIAAVDRRTADRYEVLELLLDAGADVQQRGFNDYTVLHHAACRDDAQAVSLLLRRGADPHARTRIDHYATPLEEAERFGHLIGAAALRDA